MVYTVKLVFNQKLLCSYDSRLGKYVGYDAYGIINAEHYNTQSWKMKQRKEEVETICTNNARLYIKSEVRKGKQAQLLRNYLSWSIKDASILPFWVVRNWKWLQRVWIDWRVASVINLLHFFCMSSQQCRPLLRYAPIVRLVTVSWPRWSAMRLISTPRPSTSAGCWTDQRSPETWFLLNSWITATGASRCTHTWSWCFTEESRWAAEWSTAVWRSLSSCCGVRHAQWTCYI